MKLRAERQELAEALAWVTRTVSTREHLPQFTGVLLDAAEGRLTCRTQDREVTADVNLGVGIEQPGQVLLPGRLVGQLVAKLPDAPVDLEREGDRVAIRCGRASFEVRALPDDQLPQAHEIEAEAPRGAIKAEAFAKMVGQVARAAASDDGRPVLTGVQLEASEGSLVAAATDSYRLAVRRLPWDESVTGSALVPARALSEAARTAGEVGGAVTVVFEDGQVSFVFGEDRRLSCSLIEGAFPNYEQLLPDEHETTAIVDRGPLSEALQRITILASRQANTPVKLTFSEGTLELSANNPEAGAANEAMPAEVDGEGLEIAFNPAYLAGGLEATGTDRVRIELRDGLKPAVLRPWVSAEADAEVEDLTYLLMPMRVS